MKIAVIGAKGLPARQGGIERHCEEIYPRMVQAGHSVDLYARASYAQCCDRGSYRVRGVRVVPLPCPTGKGLGALFCSALAAVAASGVAYDVIHFHALGPALFSWIPAWFNRARIVVTCHGLDWQRAKWGRLSSRLLRLGEQVAVRHADSLIVVSEELHIYFREFYGRETIYISNGPGALDETAPGSAFTDSLALEEGRYVVFLGRLVPEKCPDLLVRAFQQLRPSGWKLVLVGSSSDTDQYTQTLLHLAEGDGNIVFTGELVGTRLAEVLRGAGLFVLPSKVEGLPLAMLEAMRECVPILASDIPAHRQLTAGGRGRLFEVDNLDSCRTELDWAIQHSRELSAMARSAQRYVRIHHDWERITQQTLEAYAQPAASRRFPAGAVLSGAFAEPLDNTSSLQQPVE
ncbi:glycosyltransferase family 4 protein [Gloeobacter kilaueensis]|uniref:Lipopolysaccharide 1,2-N-acetylglucosaminetransferase n=1 Tax=Gloeobacter kilaueensis (strain ATCC BAA-2537 / CCAP 1431/1 / ULC 316 / JS1) TaxID=1183438 RepID=U5QIA7_GLOK1|nr:glycosyltransferase family 4 protein [Gloeobacter kilaueensis]AGY58628.1 lipopolysaccharide 1,2-N-acetylglucosaminetransferase [Gloeobacter kilaueensis JS1]